MSGRIDSLSRFALIALAGWAALHALFFDRFIFHDSWKHIFPVVYRIASSGSCGDLPAWLGTIDNGSPTAAYAMSFSLGHPLRLAAMYAMSCLDLAPGQAIYLHKLQIVVSWLFLSTGMYVLGRALYRNRATALYLFVATLYSGAFLDATHSDQIVSELFWIPWLTAALVLWHRAIDRHEGSLYFNMAVLFFCVALLDHYPHLVAMAGAVTAAIYGAQNYRRIERFFGQNWIRLWPVLVLLSVTFFQLLAVKGMIMDYAPSQRQDLVVHPSQFGTTGFVQPTAIVALFFPLSFLVEYDKLFVTLPQYIFKLDLLLFCFGSVPLLLAMAAFLSARMPRAAKIGWGVFTVVILAVALQQTGLYFVIFKLPFYDVFRGYFLFSVFIVFSVLILSAYGFDAFVGAESSERQALARRAVLWYFAAAAAAALLLAVLVGQVQGIRQILPRLALAFAFDGAVIAGTAWAAVSAARAATAEVWCRRVTISLAVLQLPFILGAYGMLARPGSWVLHEYGISAAPHARVSAHDTGTGIVRRLCARSAECYLSAQRTVSLNLDLQGTFLRHKDEPVFQSGLSRAAREMLSGLSHPDVWLSRSLVPKSDKSAMVSELNRIAAAGGSGLSDRTLTLADRVPFASAQTVGKVQRVSREPDRIVVGYSAPEPQFLAIAVNFDPWWRAKADGKVVSPMKVNFGGMAIRVPAGSAEAVLEYENPASNFFFISRFAMVLLAVLAAFVLFARIRREH